MTIALIVLFAILPNYEAAAYKKAEAQSGKWGEAGFPAGDGVMVLESEEKIESVTHVYTLEADAGDIRPLGVYLGLKSKSVSKSWLYRAFMGYGNDKDTAMGQYYSVGLDNGDEVIVFLDDKVYKVPRSGRVRLPIGKTVKLGLTSREYISEKTGREYKYYVDMAGGWRDSRECDKAKDMRVFVTAIIFMTVFPGSCILFFFIDRWMLKTGRADAAYRKAEEEEARKAKDKAAKGIVHKKRTAWIKTSESRTEDYVVTRKERVEEHLDKFVNDTMPWYDWRNDRRRSWGAFGGTLKFTGILMIAIIIFIYFVSYNYPMPLYVVFIVSGISLVLAFVGAKIEAWDKPERPVMTKVDPEEDHSFTISSGGQEGIISDGSQIDEVYRIFTEEKKSWQIKIEPPIGSLSEWKCYYDDKAGYVTELKLIFKTKTQVFKRGGKKPGTSEIKCLKKIFTGRRKEKIPYR